MIIRQYLAVVLLFSTFFVLGCSPQEKIQDKGEKPPPTQSEAKGLQTSPWGEQDNGLQCRVIVPKEIEQGMPLAAKIELRCEPGKVPEGVKKLNVSLYAEHLKLYLKNDKTEESFEVKPYDPSCGMPYFDEGQDTTALDGSKIVPWKTSFPLIRVRQELVPGTYTCRVEFLQNWERRRCWVYSREKWEEAGFWSGTITTGSFTLEILEETPKTKEFLVPTRLRLEKELRLMCAKEGAQKVEVPVRNGFFTGSIVYHNGKLSSIRTPPVSPGSQIGYWFWYKDGGVHTTYTIEIFETSDQPVHDWSPGPGSGGYKVLWKKSFEVHYTEKEIKALK